VVGSENVVEEVAVNGDQKFFVFVLVDSIPHCDELSLNHFELCVRLNQALDNKVG
jgi:hypothetical protein